MAKTEKKMYIYILIGNDEKGRLAYHVKTNIPPFHQNDEEGNAINPNYIILQALMNTLARYICPMTNEKRIRKTIDHMTWTLLDAEQEEKLHPGKDDIPQEPVEDPDELQMNIIMKLEQDGNLHIYMKHNIPEEIGEGDDKLYGRDIQVEVIMMVLATKLVALKDEKRVEDTVNKMRDILINAENEELQERYEQEKDQEGKEEKEEEPEADK